MSINRDDEMKDTISKVKKIVYEVKKVIIGKDEIIVKVLLSILAGGHILIEDIPGVGKTTLALAFSRALGLDYNRVQFTPDVLPSDVTGFTIYNKETNTFDYKPGAVMCNLFLADEINRTSSKTQSALLEVMEEGSVTVDAVTHEMPKPFVVIATQNPIGSVGTQLLPESQLDRFMLRLTMGYPDASSEINIIKSKHKQDPLENVERVTCADELLEMQSIIDEIQVDEKIYSYIAALVTATRTHPLIKLGVSPRGTLALAAVTRTTALLRGRTYATPDDVLFAFSDVVAHRLLLNPKARINDITVQNVIAEIKKQTPVPELSASQTPLGI